MRWLWVLALVGCKSSDPPAPTTNPPAPTTTLASDATAPSGAKPPDEMDERMRHCPVALDGAQSTVEDIDGGVRITIHATDATVAEARRRAHHVVDFAARKTRDGHGGFDGKGGGRMKNCPVVTDGVTITATDIEHGAQLDVIATGDAAALRVETRTRAKNFPFVGASIVTKPN